jgi:hypothetical protein
MGVFHQWYRHEQRVYFPNSIPGNWTLCVHPNGRPYYHRKQNKRLYITMDNILGLGNSDQIQSYIDNLERLLRMQRVDTAYDIQIYLHLRDGGQRCEYYMVNNTQDSRWVFWLDDFTNFKAYIHTKEDAGEATFWT